MNYSVIEWRKISRDTTLAKTQMDYTLRETIKLNNGRLFVTFNNKKYYAIVQQGEDCNYAYFTFTMKDIPKENGSIEILVNKTVEEKDNESNDTDDGSNNMLNQTSLENTPNNDSGECRVSKRKKVLILLIMLVAVLLSFSMYY